MNAEKPRPRARDRPRWLMRNLKSISRRKDRESLFDVGAVNRALEKGSVGLRAVLKPGMYRRITPVLKLSGWKVNPETMEQMVELRRRGVSYGKIAGELGLSPSTVYKYFKETETAR